MITFILPEGNWDQLIDNTVSAIALLGKACGSVVFSDSLQLFGKV